MTGVIVGGTPPSSFFKMRKNRIDAAQRAEDAARNNIGTLGERLQHAGTLVIGIGTPPTLSVGDAELEPGARVDLKTTKH